MAQLHGRVRGVRDRDLSRRGLALLATLLLCLPISLAPALARADEPAIDPSTADPPAAPFSVDLAALAEGLGGADAGARARAIEALSTLPEEALPSIEARLAELARSRPSADEVTNALTAIRRAVGSRRADDLVDIAPGVAAVLESDRSRATLRTAEPLLLLRSLERIGTTPALALVPAVLGLDGAPWRMEGRRVTIRMEDRAAAAAILARASRSAEGRLWATWSATRLGLDEPGAVAQRIGGSELGEILLAYSRVRTLSAIPIAASFIDSDQRSLRDAAREAFRAYGQNGIWIARESFQTRLGESADLAWGWERTLNELFSRLDAARAAHVHLALQTAREALARGEDAEARAALDAALLRSPDLATDEAALLYGQLGARATDPATRGELLRRALTIAPELDAAASWRGRLEFDRAQQALEAGVLDAEAFARAAAASPDCEACVATSEALEAQEGVIDVDRTLPYAIAAGLFALLGVVLLTWPRGGSPRRSDRAPSRAEAPPAHPEPLTLADETLS